MSKMQIQGNSMGYRQAVASSNIFLSHNRRYGRKGWAVWGTSWSRRRRVGRISRDDRGGRLESIHLTNIAVRSQTRMRTTPRMSNSQRGLWHPQQAMHATYSLWTSRRLEPGRWDLCCFQLTAGRLLQSNGAIFKPHFQSKLYNKPINTGGKGHFSRRVVPTVTWRSAIADLRSNSPLYYLLETRDFSQHPPDNALPAGARLNLTSPPMCWRCQPLGLSLLHGCRGHLISLVEMIATTGHFLSVSKDPHILFCVDVCSL